MSLKNVLVIPGIGDDIAGVQQQMEHWSEAGINPVVVSAQWNEPLKTFKEKTDQLLELAEDKEAIVGISAGGSLAVYLASRTHSPCVNVCGRLYTGGISTLYPFVLQRSARFRASVRQSEQLLCDRATSRTLTFGSLFDGIVPYSRTLTQDSLNVSLPKLLHGSAIQFVLSRHAETIADFIDQSN